MSDQDLNIPAFMRKRSIQAKERKIADKKPLKKSVKTGRKKPRATTTLIESHVDIPVITRLPSEELFPDQPAKKSGLREMIICGTCEGYFEKIDVAVIRLTSPLRKNDIIIFEKSNGLFEQKVTSMQIDRKDVLLARSGSEIGLKVAMPPKVGAYVYKVI